jgi:hypothetical protein
MNKPGAIGGESCGEWSHGVDLQGEEESGRSEGGTDAVLGLQWRKKEMGSSGNEGVTPHFHPSPSFLPSGMYLTGSTCTTMRTESNQDGWLGPAVVPGYPPVIPVNTKNSYLRGFFKGKTMECLKICFGLRMGQCNCGIEKTYSSIARCK